jgi:DNA-directed RNA polymerase I and III subunit RPAC1
VLPDDVLAHRLGLIPLRADARLFLEKSQTETKEREDDTLVFKLKVACKKNPKASADGNDDPKNLYINSNGRELERFLFIRCL